MIALGDRVRDKEYYAAGRIVGLYGRWAWLILDDDPPNHTACDVADYRSGTNRRRKSRSRLAPRRRDHTFNISLRICEGICACARRTNFSPPLHPARLCER